MRFEVLGPVRVCGEHGEIPVTADRERTLLAVLLLHPNHTVPTAQLVEAIWDTRPPAGARNQLQVCVSRLRKRLAGPEPVIQTDPAGYRAEVRPDALDLLQFRQLVTRARAAAGAGHRSPAIEDYRAALALWRGPALGGIDAGPVRNAAVAIDEERASALAERLDLELAGGAAGELVAELTELVRQHPHGEHLYRLLMLALYRAGRQADALATYRRARQLLHDDLGTEPGADLQRLHQAMLNRDPALDLPPAAGQPVDDRVQVPRELPADVAGFTGRAAALKALDELLPARTAGPPAPVVISAIAGTAGVGKTALAVHWAHRIADRFPDGQLFVNLRGYAPGEPLRPVEALAGLLRSLGVAPEQIPTDEAQAAALYRTKLAGRRALIVLDNARSVDQVRPLLPGSPGCLVLITSRDNLAGLVAREGATRLPLDVLPPGEAHELLARLLGPERAGTEPDAVTELAQACAHLPLALRITAADLQGTPDRTVAEYLASFHENESLNTLQVEGDPEAAVKTALERSYLQIPERAQWMFRLLGLVPGPDYTPAAAAALAGTSQTDAADLLRRLARAHLIGETTPGRYGFHDLLRIYARRLVAETTSSQERTVAIERLLSYYLHSAHVAVVRVYPAALRIPPSPETGTCPQPESFDQRPAALTWLVDELPNLLAAAVHAANHGLGSVAWLLAGNLRPFLFRHMFTVDWATIAGAALSAADVEQDPFGRAVAHLSLADLRRNIARYEESAASYAQAVRFAEECDWQDGQAAALGNLGTVHRSMGRPKLAADCYRRSAETFRRLGRPGGEAINAGNLGLIHYELGQLRQAVAQLHRAMARYRQVGSNDGLGIVLSNLACASWELGDLDRAVAYATESLRHHQELGGDVSTAVVRGLLAVIQVDAGRMDLALEHAQASLRLALEADNPASQAIARNNLGYVLLHRGAVHDAFDQHTNALDLARETGFRASEAAALQGLAAVQHRWGQLDDAYQAASQCRDIAAQAGYRVVQGQATTQLAGILCSQARYEEADRSAQEALGNHRETGHRLGEARTLAVLARVAEATGQPAAARGHRQHAFALFDAVGAPVPEDLRASATAPAPAQPS